MQVGEIIFVCESSIFVNFMDHSPGYKKNWRIWEFSRLYQYIVLIIIYFQLSNQ